MKNTLISIWLVLSAANVFSQSKENTYIKIIAVDLHMNTIYQINCERFEREFLDVFQVSQIDNQDSIQTFRKYVQQSKLSMKSRRIDVRRKFLYFENEKIIATICSDGKNLQLNGRNLKINEKFQKFLESMIPK